MNLENIAKRNNRVTKAKRLGRGYGSGVGGHTVGRGMKGQKSRSGHKSLVFFEGGNTPFFRRMPKYRGFNRPQKISNEVVNISDLQEAYKSGETVNPTTLLEKKLIKKNAESVKILGNGELDKKLTVEEVKVSSSALEKITKAGGTIK
jgi:large subunit ribosomal protein L15